MALIDIDELLALTTVDQIKTSVYALMSSLGLDVTAWQSGSPTRVMTDSLASSFQALASTVPTIAKSGFLDTAETGWLTLLASSVYGVTRIDATFAAGNVTINNNGGGVYSFNPGDVVFKNATSGKTYANTAAFTLAAGQQGVIVAVQAQEIGTPSNAAIGEITQFVTTVSGATVTNALPLSASDAETDDALRARCRLKLASLSPNGAAAAYQYVALTPSLNGNVSVNRVKIPTPPGDGTLTVYVASPSGTVADVTTIQTAVDTLAEPLAVTATVASAIETDILTIMTVYAKSPVPTAQNIVDAITTYLTTFPIGGVDIGTGGKLWLDDLTAGLNATYPSIQHIVYAPPLVDFISIPTNGVGVNTTVAANVTIVSVT